MGKVNYFGEYLHDERKNDDELVFANTYDGDMEFHSSSFKITIGEFVKESKESSGNTGV